MEVPLPEATYPYHPTPSCWGKLDHMVRTPPIRQLPHPGWSSLFPAHKYRTSELTSHHEIKEFFPTAVVGRRHTTIVRLALALLLIQKYLRVSKRFRQRCGPSEGAIPSYSDLCALLLLFSGQLESCDYQPLDRLRKAFFYTSYAACFVKSVVRSRRFAIGIDT
jgi:hypothetical protein